MTDWNDWADSPICPYCDEPLRRHDPHDLLNVLNNADRGTTECHSCGGRVEIEAEFSVEFRARALDGANG